METDDFGELKRNIVVKRDLTASSLSVLLALYRLHFNDKRQIKLGQ